MSHQLRQQHFLSRDRDASKSPKGDFFDKIRYMDEKKLKESCEVWGKTLFQYVKLRTTFILGDKTELKSLGLEKEDVGRVLLEMLITRLYNTTRALDSSWVLQEDLMKIILDSMHNSFAEFFSQEILKNENEKEKKLKLYTILDLLEKRYKEYDEANIRADKSFLKDDLFRQVFKNLTNGRNPTPPCLLALMAEMSEERKNIIKITEGFKEKLWKEAQ